MFHDDVFFDPDDNGPARDHEGFPARRVSRRIVSDDAPQRAMPASEPETQKEYVYA